MTTSTVRNSAKFPDGLTRESILALLRNHDFLIRAADPDLIEYKKVIPNKPVELPEGISGPTETYELVNSVPGVQAKLVGASKVKAGFVITDMENGVFFRIKAVMSTVMDKTWEIQENEGGLELVETVNIRCPKPMLGNVQGSCADYWTVAHQKVLKV